MTPIMILGIVLAVIVFIAIVCAFAWYVIVPPSEAHFVGGRKVKFVASQDDKIATNNRRTYFAIPDWIPFFGRTVRQMDVTIKELKMDQETYEKKQARYSVKTSMKYKITDVRTAAETFVSETNLREQLKEVVQSGVRAVTVKYDVIDARANKTEMEDAVREEISDDLAKWGLTLENFQLVDFQDTPDSSIISDISKRREVEIQSTTREQNAEKLKQARMKEAEAEEKAKEREIAKDRVIGEREQLKTQKIAEQQKIAEEKRFEVVKVQTIKQAEIDKAKAIVKANEEKETEAILKEKKKLEGEGDRLKAEEQAKGEAAPIREKGLAEAEAKDKLQEALNKFKPEAIRALVAEKIVEKDEAIGVATAKALETADLKVFSGGEGDKQGFDLAKMISATSIADNDSADALLNKIARPNDMGFKALGIQTAGLQADRKNKPKKKGAKDGTVTDTKAN